MNRLTKYKDGKYSVDSLYIHKAIEKLGKLEDLEEDFEMTFQEIVDIENELMTCKYLYIKEYYDKTIREIDITDYTICTVLNDYDFVILKYKDDSNSEIENVIYLDFKDYKKTWSLDKEDLE